MKSKLIANITMILFGIISLILTLVNFNYNMLDLTLVSFTINTIIIIYVLIDKII